MFNGEAKEDVTRILQSLNPEGGASEELLPLVYDELRRLAAANMARQSAGQTLQATALVHEAWLRLFNGNTCVWQSFHCTNSDGPRRGGDAVAYGGTALLGDRDSSNRQPWTRWPPRMRRRDGFQTRLKRRKRRKN